MPGGWEIRPLVEGLSDQVLGLLRGFYSMLSSTVTRDPSDTPLGRAVAGAATQRGRRPGEQGGEITAEPTHQPLVVLGAYDPAGRLAGIAGARRESPGTAGDDPSPLLLVPWSPAVDPGLPVGLQQQVALLLIRALLEHRGSCLGFSADEAVPPPAARYAMRYTAPDEGAARMILDWYRLAGFASTGEKFVMSRDLTGSAPPPFRAPGLEPGWRLAVLDPTSQAGFDLAVSLVQRGFSGSQDPAGRELEASRHACGAWVKAALAGERGGAYEPGLWLVAEDPSGRTAGFVFCLCHGPDGLHIADLAVLPGFRRAGLGRRLLLEAFRIGAERGKLVISLFVAAANEAALALYGWAGFRKTMSFCAMVWWPARRSPGTTG